MEVLKERLPIQLFDTLTNANLTVLDIISLDKCILIQKCNLSDDDANQVFEEAAKALLKKGFCKELPPWQRLAVGCPQIDHILRGGIPLNGITEIYGCSGVGKTQFALQLALMVQLDENFGGLNKGAVYICTEDVFPNKRLHHLAEAFKKKYNLANNLEDNVYIQHTAEVGQLKAALFQSLPKLLHIKPIGLVVIDSIAGVFRSDNLQTDYINRTKDFVSLISKLNNLAEKYKFAIVCLNQVTDNIETGQTEPCLGLSWSNLVTYRLSIVRRHLNQNRELKIVFTPDLPDSKCEFLITEEGLVGVD